MNRADAEMGWAPIFVPNQIYRVAIDGGARL
jgi:hypothetical protein